MLENCALVIKKNGKWSEMSIFTIPGELAVFAKSLIGMWSIIVALSWFVCLRQVLKSFGRSDPDSLLPLY